MANVTLWKAVRVAMQSAIGPNLVITAVTRANPGVAACTAHGLANGNYVLFSGVQGMSQINNRIFRVSNVTANNFTLEAEDTTLYDTFVSGNAQLITFGTNFGTLLDFNVTGGEYPEVDTTTIHDVQASSVPGIPSALVITSSSIWDVADPALRAAKAASDVQGIRAFLLTFQNNQKFLFNGSVGTTLSPSGTAQEKVVTQLKITGNGGTTTLAN